VQNKGNAKHLNEMKTQDVRLIDVFVLGPFMIWAAFQLRDDWAKVAMIAAGGATMSYNWRNYQIKQRQLAQGAINNE